MTGSDSVRDAHQEAVDLWARYIRDGRLETLERALASFRAALNANDSWGLANLSNALLEWHRRTGEEAALAEAVTTARSAVASAGEGPGLAAALNNLSGALRSSFHVTGDKALLAEAAAALRRGAAAGPEESTRAILLSNLSGTLEQQYGCTSSPDLLRESIAALRQGLALRAGTGAVPVQELVRLVNLLRTRYERTGEGDALDEAIAISRQMTGGVPPGSSGPGVAGPLSNLGVLLRMRYERTGRQELFAEAVTAGRAAVTAAAADRLLRGSAWSNLGNTLRSGYERTGDEALLTASLEAHREALGAAAEGHPDQGLLLANADRSLAAGFQATGRLALLDERIQIRRTWLAGHGAQRCDGLMEIGELLQLRLGVSNELSDLDAIIEALRGAVAAAPAGHPGRLLALSNLGVALQVRSQGTGDTAVIAEAVEAFRAATAITSAGDPARSSRLAGLAQALLSLYEGNADAGLLDEAVRAARAAGDCPDPDERAPRILADILQARYERTGDADDLRQAMTLFQASAVDAAAASRAWAERPGRRASEWMDVYLDHRDLGALDRVVGLWDRFRTHPWFDALPPDMRAGALAGAGVAHLRRYKERGDRADLDEAVRCCEASVQFTAHENYRAHLSNLSLALRDKYELDGDMASLARAAALGKTVVEMTPEASAERGDALTNLGGTLRRLREAIGDDAYLDAEVEAFVGAAEVPAADAANRAAWLNNASVGLHQRYDARGEEADLQRSIEFSRLALNAAAADPPDRAGWLSNLGNTLRHRYERTGTLADLDDAIDVLTRAAEAAPKQWTGRRECLTNLGSALRQRARVSRSPEFLRRALSAAAEAVELVPETSPEYALYAANLAVGLGTVGSATGDASYADQQIALYEELLGREPHTSVRRPWLQANLAASLLERATTWQERLPETDLGRALLLAREALTRAEPGTREYASRAGTVAGLLARIASQNGDEHAAVEADTTFRDACLTALRVEPAHALVTARQWARWREDEGAWPTVVAAYRIAAEAAGMLFATQIGRQDKEAWLGVANGMPAQAAFAMAHQGQREEAVLMLERGRVRLLAEALGRNSAALDRLEHDGQHALVGRLRVAQRRLGALDVPGTLDASETALVHAHEKADRMRGDDLASALAEHAAALDAIRQVRGFERFLLPAEPGDLAAAADKPIVYLAAARLGGMALIVRRADDEPSVDLVELGQLTEEAVRRRAGILETARQGRDRDPAGWNGTLDAVGRWLWTNAMEPVINALGGQPAACLVPTGQLALLPLHASWTPDGARPTRRRYALDHVALSYAPSAVAILHAREIAGRLPLAGLLGVADPQPVNARPLPMAAAEIDAAAAVISGSFLRLSGADAVRDRILAELPGRAVAHFACHGLARPDTPLDSALRTSGDEPLTLRDLFRLELADHDRLGMRLAVLSACETQLPGTELPDELIGLPGGFLQAGAAAVMASQWAVGDAAAALVTIMFYRNLMTGADGPVALRDAQVWLRDTENGEKASFLHPRTGRSGLPEQAARPLWRWLVQAPARERAFAMPSQWAAMTYTGV